MFGVQGFEADTPPWLRRRVVLVLIASVVGISSSAVLIRGMHDAGALPIAAWRTLGAALLLSPGIRLGLATVGRREVIGILGAGVALAGHFALWFLSLDHTTVLRSTLFVSTVPLWSALLEWGISGVRPRRALWLGALVALPGMALMTSPDPASDASWLGDGLALVAGMLWSVYFLLGRRVRQTVPITAYMGLVCAAASLTLWPAALASGDALWGYAPTTWALLLGAILLPQLVGHQGSAYAVKYLPASMVSAVMLLEPVGASLLAAVVLGEVPGPASAVGGAIVLVGVMIATLGKDG